MSPMASECSSPRRAISRPSSYAARLTARVARTNMTASIRSTVTAAHTRREMPSFADIRSATGTAAEAIAQAKIKGRAKPTTYFPAKYTAANKTSRQNSLAAVTSQFIPLPVLPPLSITFAPSDARQPSAPRRAFYFIYVVYCRRDAAYSSPGRQGALFRTPCVYFFHFITDDANFFVIFLHNPLTALAFNGIIINCIIIA
ncbi:unknown [Anaerotruncus sp. CAG:390]|nr:unknown [Anaerotruncus sp. CAG:390]